MKQLFRRFLLITVAICGVSGFAQPSERPSIETESESRPWGDGVGTDNVAYERPYSASYQQIGDKVYIVLSGVSGEKVAISEPLDLPVPGVVPKGDFVLEEGEGSVFDTPSTKHHCTARVRQETHETATHYIIVFITETYCDGEFVDVSVTTIRLRIPTAEPPDEQ